MSPSVKTVAFALALASTAAAKQVGCFGDPGSLESAGKNVYQSPGHCTQQCTKKGKSIGGLTGGTTCFCGDEVPTSDKLPDSDCGLVCTGYPAENCGGKDTWLVFTIGEENSGSSFDQRDDDPLGEDNANDDDDPEDNDGDDKDTDNGNDNDNDNDNDDDGDGDDASPSPTSDGGKGNNAKPTATGTGGKGNNANPSATGTGANGNNAAASQTGSGTAPAGTENASATGSGTSPTETGAASRFSTGSLSSLLAFAAFAIAM